MFTLPTGVSAMDFEPCCPFGTSALATAAPLAWMPTMTSRTPDLKLGRAGISEEKSVTVVTKCHSCLLALFHWGLYELVDISGVHVMDFMYHFVETDSISSPGGFSLLPLFL